MGWERETAAPRTPQASHAHELVLRGWYLRRWWLDSHGLGCPSRRRRLGLHLLLDSVVVGDPSIHLGLGLRSPESRRVSAEGTQKPASPVRAPCVMAQSWAVTDKMPPPSTEGESSHRGTRLGLCCAPQGHKEQQHLPLTEDPRLPQSLTRASGQGQAAVAHSHIRLKFTDGFPSPPSFPAATEHLCFATASVLVFYMGKAGNGSSSHPDPLQLQEGLGSCPQTRLVPAGAVGWMQGRSEGCRAWERVYLLPATACQPCAAPRSRGLLLPAQQFCGHRGGTRSRESQPRAAHTKGFPKNSTGQFPASCPHLKWKGLPKPFSQTGLCWKRP